MATRRRKLFAGLGLLSLAVLGWNRYDPAATGERRTEVEGVTYRHAGAGGLGRGDGPSGVSIDMGVPPPGGTAVPGAGDLAIAPPPAAFDAPAAPPPPPPAALRRSRFEGVTPEAGTWAVMIGINDYPGTAHDLHSAVADASDVNDALVQMGVPSDHRLVLTNGQASAETIRTSIDWLDAHAGPDAVAVFFYAGHVRQLGSKTEAIVAADGKTITDAELASMLDGLQARRTWVAIAACYGGGFTEVLRPGRVLTAAAPAGSIAYENEQFGRSYLVEYMVRRGLIEGRAGTTTIEGAFAWARNEIARDYPDRVPVQYDDDQGADLDLRPPSAASSATSSATTPSAPSSGSSSSGNSSGSSSSAPSSTTTTTAPPPNDDCARVTVGIVRCGGN